MYYRDNLPEKTKDGAYVINLDEYSDIETHWIALYAMSNSVSYFDSFRVEHIPKYLLIKYLLKYLLKYILKYILKYLLMNL